MITSYGIGEPLKNYKELELIYGPTTAKLIKEKQNEKKRTTKKPRRNSKKAKENT